MNLLCRLGRHAPRAAARWNDGYYFATCRRCGQDVVRTAFGKWHVPVGYRVVWSATPPADRPDVSLAPAPEPEPEPEPQAAVPDEPAPAEPAPAPTEPTPEPAAAAQPEDGRTRKRRILPIEAVLARLHEEQATPSEPQAAASTARRPSADWDFMNDEPPEEEWDIAPGAAPRATRPAGDAVAAERRDPFRIRPGVRREPWRPRVRQAVAKMKARLVPPANTRPWVIVACAFVIAASIGLLALALSPERDNPMEANPNEMLPSAGVPPASPSATDAFITASVLSCRSAPARQARRVRNLGRGDRVQILSREGEWVSLAHRGAQCWALGRFISEQTPL